MEDIKILLEEYKSLAGNTDAKSEERKNEIIAKLEAMDNGAVAEVAKPFVEENVTRLESSPQPDRCRGLQAAPYLLYCQELFQQECIMAFAASQRISGTWKGLYAQPGAERHL